MSLETWELLSYIVTVVGLPFAIVVFMLEQRKERQNEEEETWQQLSEQYSEFCKLLLANSDLGLLSPEHHSQGLTVEQLESSESTDVGELGGLHPHLVPPAGLSQRAAAALAGGGSGFRRIRKLDRPQ